MIHLTRTIMNMLTVTTHRSTDESFWAILAAVRWFLAFVVFSTHAYHCFSGSGAHLAKVVSLFGAQAAVLGFFLVSGASIAFSYGRAPKDFYQRRFLRIYPLYFVAVTAALLLDVNSRTPLKLGDIVLVHGSALTYFGNYLFLQGFLTTVVPFDGPLWSISIEMLYYLLAPFLYRLRKPELTAITAASVLLYVLDGYHPIHIPGFSALKFIWAWLLGFMFLKDGPSLWVAAVAMLGVPAVYVDSTAAQSPLNFVTYALTVTALASALYVRLNVIVQRFCNWLGDLSYPLYLFHVPLGVLLVEKFGASSLATLFLFSVISVILLQYVFERKVKPVFWIPLVRRLNSLTYRPKPAKAIQVDIEAAARQKTGQ